MLLPVRPAPCEHESFDCYVARLACVHGWKSSAKFQKAVGMSPSNGLNKNSPYTIRNALPQLSKITNIEVTKLESQFIVKPQLHIQLNGDSARLIDDIRTKEPRLCLECIQESPYIRNYWHWIGLNTCVEHNLSLATKCPSCNTKFKFLPELIEQCPECQIPWAEVTTGHKTMPSAFEKALHEAIVINNDLPKAANLISKISRAYRLSSRLFDADFTQTLVLPPNQDYKTHCDRVERLLSSCLINPEHILSMIIERHNLGTEEATIWKALKVDPLARIAQELKQLCSGGFNKPLNEEDRNYNGWNNPAFVSKSQNERAQSGNKVPVEFQCKPSTVCSVLKIENKLLQRFVDNEWIQPINKSGAANLRWYDIREVTQTLKNFLPSTHLVDPVYPDRDRNNDAFSYLLELTALKEAMIDGTVKCYISDISKGLSELVLERDEWTRFKHDLVKSKRNNSRP